MHAELRIRQILESPSTLSDKIHTIVEEAQQSSGDFESLSIFFHFLYNSGHIQELMGLTAGLLEKRTRISWALLLEVLSLSSLELPPSVIQGADKGLRRQEALNEIWAVESFDKYIPEYKNIRKGLGKNFSEAPRRRKFELLEKFEFLKNQRLDEEAKQVLRTLKSAYPEDAEVERLQEDFKEHRAREILTDFAHSVEETKTYRPLLAPEELEFLEILSERALEEVEEAPTKRRLEASFFFMFLEDYESALESLETGEEPLNFSEIWFKAELLRMARRLVEALDLVDKIARLYPSDSETLVATIYFRAEVYGDMGKYQEAIELLESIAKVRPHYRSTTHLLQSYKEKGF